MFRKKSLVPSLAVASAFIAIDAFSAALAATKPRPSASDPVMDTKQVEALLDQRDKKALDQLRENRQNEILYYRGRKRSEILKALGLKPTPPVGAKPPGASPTPPGTSPKPPAETAAVVPSLPLGPCATDPLLIRRDRLDTFQLRGEAVPVSNAKGASVSITNNGISNTTTASINGRGQVIVYYQDPLTPCVNGKLGDPYTPIDFSNPHYGFIVAPFVDAQGTETFPFKKTDTSNLQAGVDFQVSVFGGPLFDHQYLIATPYYQTDFRGVADVQGFQAAWEPIAPDLHLGGYIGVPNPYVDWYWQFQAAVDVKNVTNVGATGLSRGEYDWVGTTVQAHFLFFPGRAATEPDWVSPVPALLLDRFYANLTLNSFWEESRGLNAIWWEAELGYNITTDGKSSISVRYDGGKSKDTLIETKKYLLSLNFKN
jgi:hypothetical protein